MGVDWLDSAETWLSMKSLSSMSREGNSNMARKQDLARFARAVKLGETSTPVDVPKDFASIADIDWAALTQKDCLLAVQALQASTRRLGNGTSVHLADQTISRTVKTARAWLEFAVDSGHINRNPLRGIEVRTVKGHSVNSKYFTPSEIAQLFAAIDRSQNSSHRESTQSIWPARDRLLLHLAVGTGIRASEARALNVRDIDFNASMLRVPAAVTKSKRDRDIPVGPVIIQALGAYLHERQTAAGDNIGEPFDGSQALFVRKVKGETRRIDTHWLRRWLTRLCREAGVTPKNGAAFHALRHSAGVRAVSQTSTSPGAALTAAQQLLGHASVSTTGVYAQVAGDQLREQLAGILESDPSKPDG